jgi:ATP-dependent Lon protease
MARTRILLVEDDRLVRMNLALVLGREGYALDIAVCAAEAYRLLDHGHYDLILADIGLPDESGLEVLHAVKRSDPSTRVVLVTGSENPPTQEQAALEGAECLLFKPFALADLLATVRRLTTLDVEVLGGPPLGLAPRGGTEPAV